MVLLPTTLLSFRPKGLTLAGNEPLVLGIVADVHKDLMPDANQLLEVWASEASERKVAYGIPLGDFCMADAKNADFMKIWGTFEGHSYHVLGNHDMDKNSKIEMLEF